MVLRFICLVPCHFTGMQGSKRISIPDSKLSIFVSSCLLSSPFPIYHPTLSLFLSLLLSFPYFPFNPSFLGHLFPSFCFSFLFPSNFLENLNHFSYLPNSTATTLLHFFERCWDKQDKNSYLRASPSDTVIINPSGSCPRPLLLPPASTQVSSGSISLFAIDNFAYTRSPI